MISIHGLHLQINQCSSDNIAVQGFSDVIYPFPPVNGYRLEKEIDSSSSFSRSQVQKKTSVPSKTDAEPLPERRQSRWWRPLVSVPELSCLDQTHSRQTRKPKEWEAICGKIQGIWNRKSRHRQTNPTPERCRSSFYFAQHLLSTRLMSY